MTVPDYDGSLDGLNFNVSSRDGVSLIYDNEQGLKSKAKADFLNLFDTDSAALRKWSKYPLMLFGYSAEEWCIAE